MANILVSLVIGLGGLLLQSLFNKPKNQEGPRLSDINVSAVSPGNPVVKHWGTMKLQGQLIWASKLIEHKHEEHQGKGGGGATSTTYTYTVDVAIAVCQGPVFSINRIRANQKIFWQSKEAAARLAADFDNAYYEEGERLLEEEVEASEAHVGAFFFAFNNYSVTEYTPATKAAAVSYIMAHPLSQPPDHDAVADMVDKMLSSMDDDLEYKSTKIRYDHVYLYNGDEEQLPNSVIEGYKGVGNVPAYRGVCYFVVQGLQLEDFGNAMPQFQIEVQKTENDPFLHTIVADILLDAGLSEDEFCVDCSMPVIPVLGYAITQATNARGALQDLQKVYSFDGRETGFQLQVGWTDKRPQAIMDRKDFGAHMMGDELPDSETVTRAFDFDLPRRINLSYQEPGRAYSKNTVFAQRDFTEANKIDDYDITIAMTRAEAKSRVEMAMVNEFMARRSYKILLPRKYVILEPGDVVLVPEKDDAMDSYALRMVEQNIGVNGLLETKWIDHHFQTFVQAGYGEDLVVDDDIEAGVPESSLTVPYLLDTPFLSDDTDDKVGFYAILTGNKGAWPGGVLDYDAAYGSTTGAFGTSTTTSGSGANWSVVAKNDVIVPHGFTMNALPDAAPYTWDLVNELRVYLRFRDVSFSSATREDLLNQPINAVMVGDEVLQFATATDKGNGVWGLTELLRGQRGTEWAMKTHVRGERFVRLKSAAIKRVTHENAYLNKEGRFLSLTIGDQVEAAVPFFFTNTGRSQMPYAPIIRYARRDDVGDISMEWVPRARRNGSMVDGTTVSIDQPYEKYEIDLLDGETVVQTISLHDVRTTTILHADLETWFGTVPDQIGINLYQIGEVVGRGFVAQVTA